MTHRIVSNRYAVLWSYPAWPTPWMRNGWTTARCVLQSNLKVTSWSIRFVRSYEPIYVNSRKTPPGSMLPDGSIKSWFVILYELFIRIHHISNCPEKKINGKYHDIWHSPLSRSVFILASSLNCFREIRSRTGTVRIDPTTGAVKAYI